MESYTIDASGKSVGRIASEAAKLLRGSNLATFSPNTIPAVEVKVLNAAQLRVPSRGKKTFKRHSQYPGGFRETGRVKAQKDNPAAVVRHAVSGMLPKNRLRAKMLRHLKVFVGNAPARI